MEFLEQAIRDMEDPYASVVATAREARRMNMFTFVSGVDKDNPEKVTTRAMRKMVNGDVKFEIIEEKDEVFVSEAEETDAENHSFDD